MANDKKPSVNDVLDAMFSNKPVETSTGAFVERPTMECTATYNDDGTISLRIPAATPDKISLSKSGKPMLTLAIPELEVTLIRGEQRAVKTGKVPYGTVTVMVKL